MFIRTIGKKYNSTSIEIDGLKFRSKLESNVYLFLKDNNFNIIEFEPVFELQTKFTYEGKNIRNLNYKSDFLIELGNFKLILEVKGFKTPEYKIKKKLFLYKLKDFEKDFDVKLKFMEVKSLKDLKEQLILSGLYK